MDLTYMPGELDIKSAKKATDMKRDHDSVDDFEHLDPDLSPGDVHTKEAFDDKAIKTDNKHSTDLFDHAHGDDFGLGSSKPVELDSGKASPNFGFDSKQIKTEVDFHSDSLGKPSLLDFGFENEKSPIDTQFGDIDTLNKSFISAEIATHSEKTDHETPFVDTKPEFSSNKTEDSHPFDTDNQTTPTKVNKLIEPSDPNISKSMKEDDALPQYEIKSHERSESPDIDDDISEEEIGFTEPQAPEPVATPPVNSELNPPSEPKTDFLKNSPDFVKHFESHEDSKETPLKNIVEAEPPKPEPVTKPISPVAKDTAKPATKKVSISDLDDIIGPEDVFKRIGLDAWFTPERLHPKVEALVYWRDPKKSGVVFGGGMAILLSLCFMSLISVVAYTSLLALTGTMGFRIYKNILQAVQKTGEGHPFKEFLDLELSLPQDKVREIVDTAVVHINASVVELRRLFLVEDLIDSIKFGVCLWCLTYVGAIFNGMTLVILSFVALFTVPKIYENNKASIDQYIDMGRSKVAEITSKVKAAVPIGKKEPEKDKEQ